MNDRLYKKIYLLKLKFFKFHKKGKESIVFKSKIINYFNRKLSKLN